MRQETQWTTIFWEGWTALALCAAAVFWPGSAALGYPAVLWPGLALAAAGDFSICLYNPSSKKRADYLRRACDILLETLPPETVCGLARSVGRVGESHTLTTLGALRDTAADMLTTVLIGNSRTRVVNGRMVTPRGYRGV